MKEVREASTEALKASLHALQTPGIVRDKKLISAIKDELRKRRQGASKKTNRRRAAA